MNLCDSTNNAAPCVASNWTWKLLSRRLSFPLWRDITSFPAAEFATTDLIVNLSSLLNTSGLISKMHLHTELTKVWL